MGSEMCIRDSAYSPVNMAYLEGDEVEAGEYAFVKRIPFAARLSRLGVEIFLAP